MRRSTGEDRTPVRKRFGQHFLEATWARKVIVAIAPAPDDVFIEIGPGHGALTRWLAASAARVVGIEIDRDLAAELQQSAAPNVTILAADFLEIAAETIAAEVSRTGGAGRLRVAGNLPYNVGSAILLRIVHLYASGLPIADATVMLQREVADRLIAHPGSGDYGALSIAVQQWAGIARLLALPPGAFRPAPKVHSAVVGIRFHEPRPAPRDQATFERLTRAIFTRRRKTLRNALQAFEGGAMTPGEALDLAGINGQRRPETLDLAELGRLADAYSAPTS